MIHRRFLLPAALGAGAALLGAGHGPAPAQQDEEEMAPDELRAVWISRFNWTGGSNEEMQERISGMMRNLAESNFNTVLFQVRGECNVLYPSPYEPWGPQFDWTDPGWDPLQHAIDEARANGIEFHVYFNTHTLTAAVPPEETEPQHRFNLHGPDAEDSWVIHDQDGNPQQPGGSYVWLSPGHPDASAWTRKVLMHIVDNYDIDGVHFDRIRTPGRGYSYDPATVARFEGDGNPHGGEWGDFMRENITRDLRRIYGDIALRNPDIKISAAPFGIAKRVEGGYQGTGTQSHYDWYQDSFGWMQSGVLDAIFPMIYWRIGSAHPFEVLLADFLDNDGGRHIYPGIHAGRDPIAQIYESRRQGAPGYVIWSYGRGEFEAYRAAPQSLPAQTPSMPWKEDPQTAIVAGTVTDEEGEPIVDAWIWNRGDSYTYLSGGDGFYSILNLEPGTHTITVRKNGLGETTRTFTVGAGDVHELNVVIPSTEAAAMDVIDKAVELAGTDATRLLPEYVESVLKGNRTWRAEPAYREALADASDDNIYELVRAVELQFIHDPRTSALDVLGPELRAKYRNFDWQRNDYPGNGGPNEDLAREMVEALRADIFRERRANSGHDPAVRRSEATEEVWEYILDQWTTVPGEENYQLNKHAVDPYVEMREAAREDGVDLVIRSAHRTPRRAEEGAARAGNPYAVASFSSHSLGLAIDFQLSRPDQDNRFRISTRPMADVVRMRQSPEHKWLFLRGDEFGWYPFTHEPWHWEYNPPGFREVFWEDFPEGAPEPPEED